MRFPVNNAISKAITANHGDFVYDFNSRLNPYFRTQSKYSIKSATYSNTIDARRAACKFDLLGSCNDSKCRFWHFNETSELSVEDLIQDLVAYDPSFFDATDKMSGETKEKLLHSFTQQFVTEYGGKISTEEQLLILWNKMRESRKSNRIPVYECVTFQRRDWFRLDRTKSQQQKPALAKDDDLVGLTGLQYNSQVSDSFYRLKKNSRKKKENLPAHDSNQYERFDIYLFVDLHF